MRPRRVLDTNRLIAIWHGSLPDTEPVRSMQSAEAAGRAWAKKSPKDGIVTPVRIEFLGGTRDREDLRMAEAFLSHFPLHDAGRVLEADWALAEQFAKRVPRRGRRRGAFDCLIAAICVRLNADLDTDDTGTPKPKR